MSEEPENDALPAVIAPDSLERAEEYLARMMEDEARLAEEWAAVTRWTARLDVRQAYLNQRREALRAAMVRLGIKTLWAPGFTASITKARTKKVVLDEAKAIEVCERSYPKAVKIVKKLVKAEFDCFCDSFPSLTKDLFREETGDPGLTIRRKE